MSCHLQTDHRLSSTLDEETLPSYRTFGNRSSHQGSMVSHTSAERHCIWHEVNLRIRWCMLGVHVIPTMSGTGLPRVNTIPLRILPYTYIILMSRTGVRRILGHHARIHIDSCMYGPSDNYAPHHVAPGSSKKDGSGYIGSCISVWPFSSQQSLRLYYGVIPPWRHYHWWIFWHWSWPMPEHVQCDGSNYHLYNQIDPLSTRSQNTRRGTRIPSTTRIRLAEPLPYWVHVFPREVYSPRIQLGSLNEVVSRGLYLSPNENTY